MFQLHAVDRTNQSFYEKHLDRYFRLRHDIYVGERGWRDLARTDGLERDAFDTVDAIYLIGISPEGDVVAGSRLVPSWKPHLLESVFPALASHNVPIAADIFEWTRVFVVPALRSKGGSSPAAGRLYCGIAEFCLRRGIRKLSVVTEPHWFERFEQLGWRPKLLGNPVAGPDGPIIGVLLDMTEEALARIRAIYRVTGAVLLPVRPESACRQVPVGALTDRDVAASVPRAHRPAFEEAMLDDRGETVAGSNGRGNQA
jgi:acyl-homoserine lactone synthase